MEPEETASDEERRREVRRAYNRLNAQRARQRTKDKIATLTSQVNSLEEQQATLFGTQQQLQRDVQRLQQENNALRSRVGLPPRDDITIDGPVVPEHSSTSIPVARQESAQSSVRSILAAAQGAASRPLDICDNLASSNPQGDLSGLLSGSSTTQLSALSAHLAGHAQRNLRLLPSPFSNVLQQELHQQQLLAGLVSQSSTEERLLELQALALFHRQDAAANRLVAPGAFGEAEPDRTARLLELLRQQGALPPSNPP